jgi:hypothetical protein
MAAIDGLILRVALQDEGSAGGDADVRVIDDLPDVVLSNAILPPALALVGDEHDDYDSKYISNHYSCNDAR